MEGASFSALHIRAPTGFSPRYTSVLRLTSIASSLTRRNSTSGATRTQSEKEMLMRASMGENDVVNVLQPFDLPGISQPPDRHRFRQAGCHRELTFHPVCASQPAIEGALHKLEE